MVCWEGACGGMGGGREDVAGLVGRWAGVTSHTNKRANSAQINVIRLLIFTHSLADNGIAFRVAQASASPSIASTTRPVAI